LALSTFPERRFSGVNDAFIKGLGYAREEIAGKIDPAPSSGLTIFPQVASLAGTGAAAAVGPIPMHHRTRKSLACQNPQAVVENPIHDEAEAQHVLGPEDRDDGAG